MDTEAGGSREGVVTTLGRTFTPNDDGFDAARREAMWRTNVPNRYPDRIVQANSVDDVVTAVRWAKSAGQCVSVKSGGHSWSGNHVRDGGVLIDVSRLKAVNIDKTAMTATVEPGIGGSVFLKQLMQHDLFFPVGHCLGVALGGYLLQGGFGWNGRVVGPACSQVMAIDYVDANGDLRHASESENSDMLWAARGAGPDFFGVVVRFHLRLHRKPGFIGTAVAQYPVERLEDVVRWVDAIGPEVPPEVEMQFIVSRDPAFPPSVRKCDGSSAVRIELVAPVMADSWGAARKSLSYFSSRPKGARISVPVVPAPLGAMFSGVMRHYPQANWMADNLWTHASADELLPHLTRMAQTMPPPPAHFLWLNWAPPGGLPDMAFTVEDRTYLALYGGWFDEQYSGEVNDWTRDNVAAMAHLSSGIQYADDPGRPARGVSEEAGARLEALRQLHDPEGRFQRWIGHS